MQKILLLLLNVIFGSLVLWSYYSGVTKNPDLSLKLWGGVPEILRNYIVGFMFISAIGYFFFTYNFLVNVDLKNTIFLGRFPSWSLHLVYLLILIPSSLWMDLTFRYMNSGSNLDWIYVISALYCVALSSIFLLLFSSGYIAEIYKSPNFNLLQFKVINFSLLIQSILIILILSGNIGKIKPDHFKDVKKIRSCLNNIQKPAFFGSSLEYYRLPWVNGQYESNPLIKNWFYDRKYSNTPISKTPIYNLIKNGEFNSLILSENDIKNYALDMYALNKTCSTNDNFYVYLKIKS